MAGSLTYSRILPDFTDLDNNSGKKPGYKVFVLERDGSVSIQMQDADDKSDSDTLRAVFMNVDEARELVAGLNDAINRALFKNANHKSRAKIYRLLSSFQKNPMFLRGQGNAQYLLYPTVRVTEPSREHRLYNDICRLFPREVRQCQKANHLTTRTARHHGRLRLSRHGNYHA